MSVPRDKALLSRFGKRLRDERTKKGISQIRLSIQAEMSPNYVSELEQGMYDIKLSTIKRLADALGIPMHQLFRD